MNKLKKEREEAKTEPKPVSWQVLSNPEAKLADWLACPGNETKFYAMRMEKENPGITMEDAYNKCDNVVYLWEWYNQWRWKHFWEYGREALMDMWHNDEAIHRNIIKATMNYQLGALDVPYYNLLKIYTTGKIEALMEAIEGNDSMKVMKPEVIKILKKLNPFYKQES